MASYLNMVKQSIFRRKIVGNREDAHQTSLNRCFTFWDAVLIGVGHTLGDGLYVISGQVVGNVAGPASVVSSLLASVVTINVALCYAEFSSRIPWAGSAYSYAYITVGEICAFFVGWNVILDSIISMATTSITWSHYLDAVTGGVINNEIKKVTGVIQSDVISEHPNLLAVGLLVLFTLLLSFGAKKSIRINNILTILNLICILTIIITGFLHADVKFWTDEHHGGFSPYGVTGVFRGAGLLIYAYLGFEVIVSSAEEMKEPCKMLPRSIITTVVIVSICVTLMIVILSLLQPYYEVSPSAAFTVALSKYGAKWLVVVTTVGILIAMTACLIGSIYGTSRALYSMSIDGLLPPVFSKVHQRFKVPVWSIVLSGVISCILACFFRLDILIDLFAIGCLFAFTAVSACVVVLRYTPSYIVYIPSMYDTTVDAPEENAGTSYDVLMPEKTSPSAKSDISSEETGQLRTKFLFLKYFWVFKLTPGTLVAANVFNIFIFTLILAIITRIIPWKESWIVQLALTVIAIFILLNFISICIHKQNSETGYFKTPLVPLIPVFSMVLNTTLIVSFTAVTWIRFAVWMALGLVVYFGYSIRHGQNNSSDERRRFTD